MFYLKEKILVQINSKSLAQFIGLAGVAIILPYYIHIQWITGPITNAVLIITLFLVGFRSALVLCLVPSLVALTSGLLPAVLAPVVPFIMIGNAILVLTVDFIYKFYKENKLSYIVAILMGALFKFTFLFLSISLISKLLIKQELATKVAQMLSWPQFFTALTGGLIAWGVINFYKSK